MHFAERGRLLPVFVVVEEFQHKKALCLSPAIAVAVTGSQFEVIGTCAVTVVDAHEVTSLHTPDDGEPGPIAMTGVLLHVLPSGYSFDLSTRRPVVTRGPDKPEGRRDG